MSKYYAPRTGVTRLPKLTGRMIGQMLSYAGTLPLQEGHTVIRVIELTGQVPSHHLNKFLKFLAEKSV